MRKKDGLTPLHFFKNEPKLRKKDGLTPSHFFKNEPKLRKKDGLTPLHFFKNEREKYQDFMKQEASSFDSETYITFERTFQQF